MKYGRRPEEPSPAAAGEGRGRVAHAPDYGLLLVTLSLLCVGIVMVFSASLVAGYEQFGDQAHFFRFQLLWSAAGLVIMFLFMRVPYWRWRWLSVIGLIISVALLALILVPGFGSQALGATRWIQISGFKIGQPSELCKVTVVLYMADWLARKGERVKEFVYGLIPFTIVLLIIGALVIKQPDMGTALVIIVTAVTIFFVSGASLAQLIPLGLAGTAGMAALALASGYRHGRIAAFMDPWRDPTNTSYHVVQSLIALGAGGVRGVGLGVSRQKFGLLPFPYTDSIFAVIGEELGLVGCAAVLALFLILAYRGFSTARRAPDAFGSLLATGITCQMVIQAFLNIAVVTSTVPFTGITLPFVSYGGSSMLVSFAAIGILLNVSKYTRHHVKESLGEETIAPAPNGRRQRWPRLSSPRRRPSHAQPALIRG